MEVEGRGRVEIKSGMGWKLRGGARWRLWRGA